MSSYFTLLISTVYIFEVAKSRSLNLNVWPNDVPDKSSFLSPTNQELLATEEDILGLYYSQRKTNVDYKKASTLFMLKLFNELRRGNSISRSTGQFLEKLDISKSDTIRSFSAQAEISTHAKGKNVNFKIPNLPANERLRSAELRFLKHPTKSQSGTRMRFKIELNKGDSVIKKYVLRDTARSQGDHEVIDVSRIVRPWINGYHGNVTIHIHVPKKLKIAKTKGAINNNALVVFYLEDREFLTNVYKTYNHESSHNDTGNSAIRSRQKRHRLGRGRRRWNLGNKRQSDCKLHDFEVDFNTIGWGQWIIHPKKFNARFCYGKCSSPIDVKYKPTNHAMLQTLMRSKRPNSAPVACCVPTKLKPLSMLYYEYDEIVVRHHEEMVASECGCR